jgi:phage-related protein
MTDATGSVMTMITSPKNSIWQQSGPQKTIKLGLANVLNLGHTQQVKAIKFHPKALEFIREQSASIKQEIGEALRDVQRGVTLGMPLSKPMPDVAAGTHELRIKGETTAVRIFYFVKMADAIAVFHGFQKQTQKTPRHEIQVGQKRLKEILNGKI